MAKRFQNQTEELIDTLRSGIKPALQRLSASIAGSNGELVTSLDSTRLVGNVVEAVGTPVYVDDVTDYPTYNLTDTGWYVFARIIGTADSVVTADTTVTGAAGYVATVGNEYVDVAVKFEVASVSQVVTIEWTDGVEDVFIFKATDLAIRNLDYRVTFYVYDADDYVTWEYALTTDQTFQAGKDYYISDGEGGYTLAEVQTVAYVLTSDAVFQSGKTYYISDGEGGYTAATVQTVAYALTEDETFVEGKTYYTTDGTTYTAATVTTGETIPENTYYEASTVPVPANTYYEQTTVAVPADTYYNHSKCIISGLVRNVTYKLDQIIDCPMEFILPEIEDETHGCWFEIRCRHAGEYSMTLTPPSADVKIATEHTQKETAGINMINLHYTVIDDLKIWRFLNTHSSIPTT